jgi:fibronectin type 3 domain-containing protein
MRRRGFVLYLLMISFFLSNRSLAQRTGNVFAAGGPLGIYVSLGTYLPSQIHSVNGGTAYRLERRISGEQNWQELALISAPTSLEEFRSRIIASMHQVPDSIPLRDIPVDSLWARINKYRLADSLKFWSGVLLIRLASGMMYLDTTAKPRISYQYRVSLFNPPQTVISSSISNVASYPSRVNLPKLRFYDKSSTENEIVVQWTSGQIGGASTFKTFRQDGLRGDFHPVAAARLIAGKDDSIFYMIADTLIQSMQGYRYFILPMDYFGNPSVASDTVIVGSYNFRNVSLPDNFNVTSVDTPGGIRISWHLAEPQLVRNLEIYRSVDYDTGYHKLSDISTGDTSYIDETAKAMQRYFYYLIMKGPLGEVSPPSARVFGMYISPLAPIAPGLIGAIGTSRGVQLTIVSTDIHQRNYQVYRNDGITPELHLISGLVPLKDSLTVFEDTSNSLSGKLTYSYAVRAENESHLFSPFSDTVHVRPHILTHPPAPLGLTATVEENVVQLYWNDMSQFDNSIQGYNVFRREIIGGKPSRFIKLNDSLISVSRNRFTDTTAVAGRLYEYSVKDYDFFGGESPLSLTSRAEIPKPRPIAPSGVRGRVTETGIIIQWDGTFQPDVKEYKVYRYQRRQRPILIANVKASGDLEATDKNVKSGGLYFYFVTTVNAQGIESDRSQEIGVRK